MMLRNDNFHGSYYIVRIKNMNFWFYFRTMPDDDTILTVQYQNISRDPNMAHWRAEKSKDECVGTAYIELNPDGNGVLMNFLKMYK